MGLEVFDHYECDGQIELFAIQEENMGTDKKTAERFYENYKACRDEERERDANGTRSPRCGRKMAT